MKRVTIIVGPQGSGKTAKMEKITKGVRKVKKLCTPNRYRISHEPTIFVSDVIKDIDTLTSLLRDVEKAANDIQEWSRRREVLRSVSFVYLYQANYLSKSQLAVIKGILGCDFEVIIQTDVEAILQKYRTLTEASKKAIYDLHYELIEELEKLNENAQQEIDLLKKDLEMKPIDEYSKDDDDVVELNFKLSKLQVEVSPPSHIVDFADELSKLFRNLRKR